MVPIDILKPLLVRSEPYNEPLFSVRPAPLPITISSPPNAFALEPIAIELPEAFVLPELTLEPEVDSIFTAASTPFKLNKSAVAPKKVLIVLLELAFLCALVNSETATQDCVE